jgi:hypothetical protein
MSQIRPVLSMLTAFVVRSALAILVIAVALALTFGRKASPDDRTGPAREGRATVSDDGETVHVTLDTEKADTSTRLLLHGAGGREVAELHIYPNGMFTVEAGRSEPSRFVVYRGPSGLIAMCVVSGPRALEIQSRADGSAEVKFQDAAGKTVHAARVDAGGDFFSNSDPDHLGGVDPCDDANRWN